MASIRKRAGKYQVQIRRKGFAPTVRTFHTKQDAQEWARFMDTKADRGELFASVRELSQYTLKEVLERYIREITAKKRSADTETYILEAFLRHPIAKLKLSEVTAAHFSKYRQVRLIVFVSSARTPVEQARRPRQDVTGLCGQGSYVGEAPGKFVFP